MLAGQALRHAAEPMAQSREKAPRTILSSLESPLAIAAR
jgi:hypothetical protein